MTPKITQAPRTRTVLILAAALSLLGAACGGDTKEDGAAKEAEADDPTSTDADATTAEESIEPATTEPESSVVPSSNAGK
jgi:hypothetical protein